MTLDRYRVDCPHICRTCCTRNGIAGDKWSRIERKGTPSCSSLVGVIDSGEDVRSPTHSRFSTWDYKIKYSIFEGYRVGY